MEIMFFIQYSFWLLDTYSDKNVKLLIKITVIYGETSSIQLQVIHKGM